MQLYVCWGTFRHPFGHVHPCQLAYAALREAGHDPQVIRVQGLHDLPDALFNPSAGRRLAKRLTGSNMVPLLITDNGEAINESARIAAWGRDHRLVATA
jgi:hypothetical protein